MWNEYLTIVVLFLLSLLVLYTARNSGRRRFPGPTPFPIIGNIIPPGQIWKKLAVLGQEYGPVFSLRTFGKPMLVLNGAAIAREILDVKSAIYWSRPVPKLIELAGMDRGVLFENDPIRLRQSRKMLNIILSPRKLENYRSVMEKYVVQFLNNLLESPERFSEHIRSVPGGITLEMSHGYKIHGAHDPVIEMADITVQNFSKANRFGSHITNFFPSVADLPSFLPGMGFKRDAISWRNQAEHLCEQTYKFAKDEIAKGIAKPSMVSQALEKPEEYSEYIIKYTSTQVYSGGADTTVSSLLTFFSTMVRYPDVQRKAQVEIDCITGGDRLPLYSDRINLPYMNAVLTEMIRLYLPIPVVARVPAEDDVHNGYYISKDTLIIINLWAMLRDETLYPDPDVFRPERWLSKEYDAKLDPWGIAFGFGRRICPGRDLAEQLLFTTIACTLSAFDISPAKDDRGEAIMPSGEYTDGGIISPLPFECTIRPRSSRARELVMNAVNEVDLCL
ncbi:O-methylsterigmatocystin oxidoreductase [Grifola frondosa]|uniref:O-methylsterigmatocystin oxidoreductase n=1 Tax=Grifola frondosa TaxID=5627 RepID=A0A1C7LVV0_GRIFR|nr:O-methylsterigmatocystin oxidoreductase [Grifola frondosa]